LYVYNANPNLINYSYTSASDLNSANKLLETYMVVIKSNKVMDAVVAQLSSSYPGITPAFVMSTLSMGSVSETGVMRISCTTVNPQMSADICNAVVDYAPAEIIRVVSAGSIEVIDYAEVPQFPNSRSTFKKGVMGALAGFVIAGGLLVLIFLLNRKVTDSKDLTEHYTLPILSEIPRHKNNGGQADSALLSNRSTPSDFESYNKLRMNLGFAMVGKRRVALVSSAIPGEGKSTIAANLAITVARSGKRVLLVDADMRCGSLAEVFKINQGKQRLGLSNMIIHECKIKEAVIADVRPNLDLMLSGSVPPNPAELLASESMSSLLCWLETSSGYDLIIMDMPPINAVSDPLILAKENVGLVYVVRQNYSDHREIVKALRAVEFSEIDVMGMVLYGENVHPSGSYRSGKYTRYYHNYHKTAHAAANGKWALRPDSRKAKEDYRGKHAETSKGE